MFTLQIGGTPVAITDADETQAREIFNSDVFKQDLKALTSEGAPLWDGQAAFDVRPASQEEIAAFDSPEQELGDEMDGEEEDGGIFVTFLVPIDHDHEESLSVPPEVQG